MDFSSARNYRIDWVVSFVAVARHGGFSAAAKALYRSQPRISSHVADLEHALGTRLFDRTVQPAALTPEGRALLPHGEEIVRRFDVLAEVTAGASGAVRGDVRIGIYPSVGAYLFPLAVRHLKRVYPHVSLALREGQTLGLGAALGDGELDLAVRPLVPLVGDRRLASTVLWREPLVAVFPLDHALAGAHRVRLAQIAGYPLVTLGENAQARTYQFETNQAFAEAGLSPEIAFQTNQPQTLVSLVRHGLGVGITNGLAMIQANRDGVACVPLLDTHCHRTVALWWREGQPRSGAVDAVREVIADLPRPRFPWGPNVARVDPPVPVTAADAD